MAEECCTFVASIRLREVCAHGEATRARFVYCPLRRGSIAIEGCSGCPRLIEEAAAHITCAIDEAEPPRSLDTAVGRIAQGSFVCVPRETAALEVRNAFAVGAINLAVIVDGGRCTGIVDTAQLQAALTRQSDTLDEVERFAVPLTPVPESSSIVVVASQMVRRGTRRLAIVDAHGGVVGVVDDLTLLRALAPPRS